MLQETWKCKCLSEILISILWNKYSEAEWLDHTVVLFLIFLRSSHTVFNSSCTFLHSYQQCARITTSPQLCQPLFLFFDNSHPYRYEVILRGLVLCFSADLEVEHFSYTRWPAVCLLQRNVNSTP